jgi:hypothetical protein
VQPPADDPWAGRGKRVLGLSFAGAGVAMIGTAIFFGIDAQNAAEEVEERAARGGEWTRRDEDVETRGKRSEILAISLFGAGGVAIAGGAVLYYLGLAERHQAQVAISGSGSEFSIAVAGRF